MLHCHILLCRGCLTDVDSVHSIHHLHSYTGIISLYPSVTEEVIYAHTSIHTRVNMCVNIHTVSIQMTQVSASCKLEMILAAKPQDIGITISTALLTKFRNISHHHGLRKEFTFWHPIAGKLWVSPVRCSFYKTCEQWRCNWQHTVVDRWGHTILL